MEVWSDCEMRLRDAASKKILVEVALLKAIEARRAMSLDSVLQQLQNLRGGGAVSTPASATPSPAPPAAKPAPTPVPKLKLSDYETEAPATVSSALREAAAQPAVTGGSVDLTELWSRLLELVGRASPFSRTYLLEAHPVSFVKNVFTIGFDPEFQEHIGLVDNARNHTLLQTKLSELGHPNSQIKFIKAERATGAAATPVAPAPEPAKPAPPPAPTPAPKEKTVPATFNKDDFKNDPLIQKALEIFKGQIVEVR
jgi:DNA polymerase-3 subunit gamma/tau